MRGFYTFALRFFSAYAAAVLLWMGVLEGPYNQCLARSSMFLLTAIEQPRLTTSMTWDGRRLIARHIPHFSDIPDHQIDPRRVHSNTVLFTALTLATPGPGWLARGLCLFGGGLLLSASHVAHVIASVQWRYALHNAGPYSCSYSVADLDRLGFWGLRHNPPAFRRRLVLAIESAFNIVLERVLPCALWLPLFLATIGRRGVQPVDERRWNGRRWSAVVGLSFFAIGSGWLLASRFFTGSVPETIEGVRLGSGVFDAKQTLVARGYTWTKGAAELIHDQGLWSGFSDAWPPRLDPQRGRPRYNWIGLRITQPPGRTTLLSGCITAIATAPSETRQERYQLRAEDLAAACRQHWDSLPAERNEASSR